MFVDTFQGYNCYSSALGECAVKNRISQIEDVISTQWSFYFNQVEFDQNQWYTGAAGGPVDVILKNDLKNFCDISVKEHSSTEKSALEESKEVLKKQGYQILLVDFYYLNSFNWKSLRRFHVEREHDPHFIILKSICDEQAHVIDPFYHHEEFMSLESFMQSRNSTTKQGKLIFNSYEIVSNNTKNVTIKELLHHRFQRYLEEKMYENIIKFKETVRGQKGNTNRKWAFTGYNCLNSIIYQHRNLLKVFKQFSCNLANDLCDLENRWAIIRKKMFEYYIDQPITVDEIEFLLSEIAFLEEKFTKQAIAYV